MNEAKEWLKQNYPYLSDAEEQLAIKAFEAGMNCMNKKMDRLCNDCMKHHKRKTERLEEQVRKLHECRKCVLRDGCVKNEMECEK